ncbi:signal transduction histidine kinase [Agromyces terreus]|uniref:histidine kinase n=1 Tax=Agromyces terreus TaxID=424795 RepID=A0A9X2GZN8_9MICO|nr:sensor histidine kinase [Agromyces terreus]MCP2369903.1 signal transduction histidine kinase [Agromyces terreus]
MVNRRWWDAAALAVALVTVLVGLVDPPYGADDVATWAVTAAFLLAYALYLRGRIGGDDGPRHYVAIVIVLTALSVAGTAAEPSFAMLQAFAYPFLWITAPDTRRAVIGNGILATGIVIGYVLHFGAAGIVTGLTVGALSLGFALALGLWITRIAEYGDERARLLADLQSVQGELAALHREAGVGEERARLAREIHDTIAQSLTGLVMVAQRAGNRLTAVDGPAAASVRADVSLIEEMAREALTEARGLVATIAPVTADGGLAASLDRLAAAFERETGTVVRVQADATGLDRELEVVVLRCAQEGLANVRKHAQAATAWITVEDSADGVVLTVRDDGVGPTAHGEAGGAGDAGGTGPGGFGLAGLRDRAALVGGSFAFGPAEGGGALLRVTVPRRTATAEETR